VEIIVSRRSSNFPFTLIVVEVSDVVGSGVANEIIHFGSFSCS
jgi:hypothetical protein